MDEACYLKRKIRSGSLDVHPTEKALVVNYDIEALILGELGDPVLGDKKKCQKVIRLKSLNADTNVSLLAREVIDKCSLIHESKLHEVEQLIYYLQNRQSNDEGYGENSRLPRPSSTSSMNNENNTEKAIISNIDDYIDLLYEEIPEKVKGSSLILQLAKVPDNLLELSKNESLLSALARVLREDWRRSIELSTNIIYIFFCFSTYSRFHNVILEYRIGSLSMEIIDFELHRYDQWKEDIGKQRQQFENNDGLFVFPADNCGIYNETVKISEGAMNNTGSFIEVEIDKLRDEPLSNLPQIEIKRLRDELEKHEKKYKSVTKRQEQLLRVAFYLLLNIAENAEVEKKMRKKNLIGMLVKTLDRFNSDLLILVVTFLKKLSIFRENKDLMAEENLLEKLPKMLQVNNPDLLICTLKLLYNLSFDTKLRTKMIKIGMLPKLIKFLTQSELSKSITLGLLYHLSMDDKVKAMFTNYECVPALTEMLLELNDEVYNSEVLALCINLALNDRNAELMIQNNRLQRMISKAFRNQDPLIMKMIRNIAEHDCTKESFIEFVGDLAMAVTQSNSQDFILEIVGIMGNLNLPDLDYSQIFQRCNLIPWVRSNMIPGKTQDDLVLEIVILLGTAAADEDCTQLMCKTDILLTLIELMKAKQEDDEMVLQIIYVFYQISKHDSTRDYLVRETEAPAYLIDLMHDKNPAIRRVCDTCLDIIATCYSEWALRIKVEKFRSHNEQWLEMVESIAMDPTNIIPDDVTLPPFMSGDLFKHTILFPSEICLSYNTDDTESVTRAPLGSSNRPISRKDVEDLDQIMARSKS